MQYNTQQKRMPLPEYGRSIQNMVDHALTIEDRAERQRCANTIINIMGNMFPHLRDVPDFKHKLWDHLAIMANFQLTTNITMLTPRIKVKPHTKSMIDQETISAKRPISLVKRAMIQPCGVLSK